MSGQPVSGNQLWAEAQAREAKARRARTQAREAIPGHIQFLDEYFSKDWEVFNLERFKPDVRAAFQGFYIDRLFIHQEHRTRYFIQYVVDEGEFGAGGNMFIETNITGGKPRKGWAYTSTASILVYYIPAREEIILITTLAVRNRVKYWFKQYPKRVVDEADGIQRVGVVVPVKEVVKHAWAHIQISPPQPTQMGLPEAPGEPGEEQKAPEAMDAPEKAPEPGQEGQEGQDGAAGPEPAAPARQKPTPKGKPTLVDPRKAPTTQMEERKPTAQEALKDMERTMAAAREREMELESRRQGTGPGGVWDEFDEQFPDDPPRAILRRNMARKAAEAANAGQQ